MIAVAMTSYAYIVIPTPMGFLDSRTGLEVSK